MIRVFPVDGAVWFQDWHSPPGRPDHEAQDIFGTPGIEVRAVDDGLVSRVMWTEKGGNTVRLAVDQGGGVVRVYYYAHLDTVAVEEGDKVEAGDLLGTLGNTGNASDNREHLHLAAQLWRSGRYQGKVNLYRELRALKPSTKVGPAPRPFPGEGEA